MQPFVPLRAPKLFNLRSDPFERAEHEAGDYDKWFIEHIFVLVPAQAIVGQFLATFQEFPPASIKRAKKRAQANFAATLARAKRLDAQGNRAGCTRALAAAKDMYNLH